MASMCVQVRKGRFVVLTEGHAGADSAFCMGGEQLWLGKVEQRGPSSIQLLMYKPQRNAAGEGLLHALCIFKASAVGRVGEACGSLARQANLSLSSFHAGSTSLGHIDRVRCRC